MDLATVHHIAKLARIKLNQTEAEHYATDLTKILDLASQLQSVNTDDVEPMAHPFPGAATLRDDCAESTLPHAALLSNAPAQEQGYFCVPPILETE